MKHPEQLFKIVKELRSAISIPFTVKIRSGWDSTCVNAVEIAIELERLGVDAICVHARTRKQGYQDLSNWQLVRKVKENVKIPVILSGDVTNAYTAQRAYNQTNCDFIMCGRGAKANPSLFSELVAWYKTDSSESILTRKMFKPKELYNKNTINTRADFFDFLRLYRTREHRNKLSEIIDHAIWTATCCKGHKRVVDQLRKAKGEKEVVSVFQRVEV